MGTSLGISTLLTRRSGVASHARWEAQDAVSTTSATDLSPTAEVDLECFLDARLNEPKSATTWIVFCGIWGIWGIWTAPQGRPLLHKTPRRNSRGPLQPVALCLISRRIGGMERVGVPGDG